MNTSVNHQHIQEAIAARLSNIHAALQTAGFNIDRASINSLFSGSNIHALSDEQQAIVAQSALSYDLMLSHALSANGQHTPVSVSAGLSQLAKQAVNPEQQTRLQNLANLFNTQAENLAKGQPVNFTLPNANNMESIGKKVESGGFRLVKNLLFQPKEKR